VHTIKCYIKRTQRDVITNSPIICCTRPYCEIKRWERKEDVINRPTLYILRNSKCNLFLWPKSPTWAQAVSLLTFLDDTKLDTHARKHAYTHTHTHGRTPLNERSDRRRGRYVHNTQQTQGTNSHAVRGIRTRDPNHREAADLCLRPHSYWDRQQCN
jgi:hypothetical protein